METRKLSFSELQRIEGGGVAEVTGMMCVATVFLLFSTVFAPLAAETGIGCATGLYSLYGNVPKYEG